MNIEVSYFAFLVIFLLLFAVVSKFGKNKLVAGLISIVCSAIVCFLYSYMKLEAINSALENGACQIVKGEVEDVIDGNADQVIMLNGTRIVSKDELYCFGKSDVVTGELVEIKVIHFKNLNYPIWKNDCVIDIRINGDVPY